MKKNLKILCDDDSIDFQQYERCVQTTKNQTKTQSPFKKTSKNFDLLQSLTMCQTPQSRTNFQQSFQFKSPKYVGIIQKNILQRLEFYDQKQKKQNQDVTSKLKEQQIWIKELKDKPQINQTSKRLFQKVKKQKRLSPNILQRFQTYQCQRVTRNAKYELIKTYGMEGKNNISICRKNMNYEKSRSPLRQNNLNRQQSRSKSRSPFKKTIQNKTNIGKIVNRKLINDQKNRNQTQYNTSNQTRLQGQLYKSLTPKSKLNLNRQQRIYQQPEQQSFTKQFQTKQKLQSMINKQKSFSQINTNKKQTKKWKVIT